MKKSILALLLAVAGVCTLAAAETAQAKPADPAAKDIYETFMFTIWEDTPEYQMYTPTYGVKLGILGCGGAPVYGAEGAVVCAGSKEATGFKGAIGYTNGEKLSGAALAVVNLVDEINGVEIGVVNVAKKGGIQIGILNFMEDGFLPCFPIVNFSLK